MIKNQTELINNILSDLEHRPLMLIQKYGYAELSSYLAGFVMALDMAFSTEINPGFTKWLWDKRKKKNSLVWQVYLLTILSNGNEELACNLLLKEFRNYISTLNCTEV